MRGSDTIKSRRARKAFALLIVALVVALATLLFVNHVRAVEQRDALHKIIYRDCRYARSFYMHCVATPEVDEWGTIPDLEEYPDEYKRVEFVMEFPPEDKREYGVIYAAPGFKYADYYIENLNRLVYVRPSILDGTDLKAPLTLEDVIYKHDSVRMVIDGLEKYETVFFRLRDKEYILSAPDGWDEKMAAAANWAQNDEDAALTEAATL